MIDGDPLVVDLFSQVGETVVPDVDWIERGAIQQRAIDIHHGSVEAIRRKQRQAIFRVDAQIVGIDANEVQHIAVVLHHAFRLAG